VRDCRPGFLRRSVCEAAVAMTQESALGATWNSCSGGLKSFGIFGDPEGDCRRVVEGSSGSCQAIRLESNRLSIATGLQASEEAHGRHANRRSQESSFTRRRHCGTDWTNCWRLHRLPCRRGVGARRQGPSRTERYCNSVEPANTSDRRAASLLLSGLSPLFSGIRIVLPTLDMKAGSSLGSLAMTAGACES